ncbi:hypothetical protein PV327_009481 [Microctonus hyperodae]|uniref:Uncharacterized protein n=1 Tax=Microctonus hyperodae TaxID=165561 RepID=A0AA39FTW1_MICHY|nr:hypothetical protein PV327_009481 [Microctonus hyperodae]
MRETSSHVMEDAMTDDDVMDCGLNADDGMDDLEDSASNINISTSKIQDAAERLLTLLCVNELDDDYLSSSEDEGVGIDSNYDENDDDEYGSFNSRLLQQLATSLTEELKYVKIQNNNITIKNNTQSNRTMVIKNMDDDKEQTQRMDITYTDDEYQTIRGQSSKLGSKYGINYHASYQHKENLETKYQEIICKISDNEIVHSLDSDNYFVTNKRCRSKECHRNINEEKNKTSEKCESPSLWSAGWDSCAAEAIRYLIEVEGLDPSSPTVLALKDHLEIQRKHALCSYAI